MVGATICITAGKSCTVLTTALSTIDETLKIVLSSNNSITDTRKILYTPPTNKDNGVLLQVVGHPRNVGRHTIAVTQQNARDFSQRGVGLTGRCDKDLETGPFFLWTKSKIAAAGIVFFRNARIALL
jgi:hypothetical protein